MLTVTVTVYIHRNACIAWPVQVGYFAVQMSMCIIVLVVLWCRFNVDGGSI